MAGKRKRTSRTLREAAVTGRESRCRPPRRRRALIAVISLLLPLSAMGALMVRRSLAPPKSSSGSAPTREVAAPSSAQTSKIAMQVDFRNYKAVSGVQWPFDIIHWYGGKVDYRITVTDVKANQPLADTLFQKP